MKQQQKSKKKKKRPLRAPKDPPVPDSQPRVEGHDEERRQRHAPPPPTPQQEQQQRPPEEAKILYALMEAFDSVSLEDAASAHKEANGDVNKAAEILANLASTSS